MKFLGYLITWDKQYNTYSVRLQNASLSTKDLNTILIFIIDFGNNKLN